MKIPYRDIESFVKSPAPAARVILVYGPDNGLVGERAKTMGMGVVSDYNDPFNVAALSSDILQDDPARLSDEAGAMSMMGGDRLIRIEGAGDKITHLIKDYLAAPNQNALVILQAGELGPRSSLRKLCESADNAAAIPCYVEDERDLSRLIRTIIQEEGLSIDNDAVAWLAVNIAGDRAKVRSELGKVVIYKGAEPSPISLTDVQTICGTAGAQSLDDLVYSVGSRNAKACMKTYQKLLEEGVNFVVIVRALQNHFRRLHLVRSQTDTGESIDFAMKSLQPPVFFKQQAAFKTQAQGWSKTKLEKVMDRMMNLEAECKQTGAPVETLCAQVLVGLAR